LFQANFVLNEDSSFLCHPAAPFGMTFFLVVVADGKAQRLCILQNSCALPLILILLQFRIQMKRKKKESASK
jgi:hypothetical protein